MNLKAGDTFVGTPTLGTTVEHFWVVVHVDDSGLCAVAVAVNATSWKDGADTACVVNPGDHPYFSHKSYMFYAEADEFDPVELEGFTKKSPASPTFLKRVIDGLHASKFTKRRLKQIVPKMR